MSDTSEILPVEFSATAPSSRESIQEDRVVRAVQFLNRTEFSPQNESSSTLEYGYDAASHRSVVVVRDRETNAVLYQLPTSEVLRMAAQVRQDARRLSCGDSSHGCDV